MFTLISRITDISTHQKCLGNSCSSNLQPCSSCPSWQSCLHNNIMRIIIESHPTPSIPPVTSLTEVDTPLAFIVPLVNTEDCVGQGVVTQELLRTTRYTRGGSGDTSNTYEIFSYILIIKLYYLCSNLHVSRAHLYIYTVNSIAECFFYVLLNYPTGTNQLDILIWRADYLILNWSSNLI